LEFLGVRVGPDEEFGQFLPVYEPNRQRMLRRGHGFAGGRRKRGRCDDQSLLCTKSKHGASKLIGVTARHRNSVLFDLSHDKRLRQSSRRRRAQIDPAVTIAALCGSHQPHIPVPQTLQQPGNSSGKFRERHLHEAGKQFTPEPSFIAGRRHRRRVQGVMKGER
jgi:hypothetical protein